MKKKTEMQSHALPIRCKKFLLVSWKLFLGECQKTHDYLNFFFGRDDM